MDKTSCSQDPYRVCSTDRGTGEGDGDGGDKQERVEGERGQGEETGG